jgi:hypothetical protein
MKQLPRKGEHSASSPGTLLLSLAVTVPWACAATSAKALRKLRLWCWLCHRLRAVCVVHVAIRVVHGVTSWSVCVWTVLDVLSRAQIEAWAGG